MKFRSAHISLLGIFCLIAACTSPQKDPSQKEVLFQVSTIDALLAGSYDGEVTCGQVRQHGDFGIGTFNGLDGEMVQLDGNVYKIRSDGKVYPVPDSTQTPFASVTYFEADTVLSLVGPLSYEQLCSMIDSAIIPTQNIFYAIKIEGVFSNMKARSVPRQSKPYIPLVEVVKTQPVFEYERARGTLVGFRTPPYMQGLNVPGYHLHYLNQERDRGGHVLDCTIEEATLSIDYTANFHMVLPSSGSFHQQDLTQDRQEELEKVEK